MNNSTETNAEIVEETSFEDAPISLPSSPLPHVEEDNDAEGNVKSVKKTRGKGIDWMDHLEGADGDFIVYKDLQEVMSDARHMNYSKIGSSSTDVHLFKCRITRCMYKRKYRRFVPRGHYISYFYGIHDHSDPISRSDHRGFPGDQKILVEEAFEEKRKSARDIISFIRSKKLKID